MQGLPGDNVKIRIGTNLHQMLPLQQFAGDQLFVAEHFAVAHLSGKIAVCGRGDAPAFRSKSGSEVLILEGRKDVGEGTFHRQAMLAE